jgi:hypothetical protein
MRLFLRSARAKFHPQKILRSAVPPALTVTAASATEITVAWAFVDVANADQVEIERSLTAGSGFSVIATETNTGSGSYADTGRTAATTYYYRARGLIATGAYTPYSPYSVEVSATTTGASTPAQPANVTATETARDDTTVMYTLACDAVSGATSYDWYVGASTDGGYSNADATTPNNVVGSTFSQPNIPFTRSSADNEASPNVRARNASGPGPWKSLAVTVPGNLGAPVFNTATVSGTSVIITYTEDDEADAADEYKIERSDNDGADYSVIATKAAGTAAPQFTDTGLASDTYLYRIRAHDTTLDAYSSYSAVKSSTVGGAPPSGYFAGQDFTLMSDLGDLVAGFSVANPENILFDDGTFVCAHTGQASGITGLLYRFLDLADRPGKGQCADHSLSVNLSIGSTGGFDEIWWEGRAVFSSNWTTEYPGCTVNTPDYKFVLVFPVPDMSSGAKRWDFRIGHDIRNMFAAGHGFPGPTAGPQSAYDKSTPINATTLWDGQPHHYRAHCSQFSEDGSNKCIVQFMTDGQVTHSIKDFGNTSWDGRKIKKVRLGANRNQAAPEEMYVWWLEFYVYTSDPGWFTGVAITDYT